jgi:hypothetical protein
MSSASSHGPALIVQVARGGLVDRQLHLERPQSVASGDVVVEAGPADEAGALVAPDHGDVVLSLPSPEALARERDEVHRVIGEAGRGVEPVVVVVEAAEEVRDEELAPVLEAAKQASRPVILRIIRDA